MVHHEATTPPQWPPVLCHDSNGQWFHFWFNSPPQKNTVAIMGSRYVSFCSFLVSSNYYLVSKLLLMTGVSAKRASAPHYPSPLQTRCEVFWSRQEGLKSRKRDVGRSLWRAGENPTIPINECRHTNSFKPFPPQSRKRWRWASERDR